MNPESKSDPATPGGHSMPRIKFIGVGGAGCRLLDHLIQSGFAAEDCCAVHTHTHTLGRTRTPHRLLLGNQITRGLSAGGDTDLAAAAAEADGASLTRMLEGVDIVFLIAGLGGGTGSGASPVVARIARQAGALVLAFVILPFECEGKKRQRQAMQSLRQFKAAVDGVVCLPNQYLLKLISAEAPLTEAFATGNEWLVRGIQGVWRMLARPGLITVDFADLRNCLRGRHSEGALASAKAAGSQRAKEAAQRILANPLLGEGEVLRKAETIILSLAGNSRLSLPEINQVVSAVKQVCDKANLILGATCDESLGDELEVTLIAANRYVEPESIAPLEDKPVSRLPDKGFAENNLGLDLNLLSEPRGEKPRSALLPPAPQLNAQQTEQLLKLQAAKDARLRKNLPDLLQGQLPLQVISKGRFEKTEPTIHRGEDLDKPTFIRRSIPLN